MGMEAFHGLNDTCVSALATITTMRYDAQVDTIIWSIGNRIISSNGSD
jgi:hypothetical protein